MAIQKFQNPSGRLRIQFSPEQITQFERNVVPGTNTNSNVTINQSKKSAQQAQQRSRRASKQRMDDARWNARQQRAKMTAEEKANEYTQRQIAEATKPTWRTTVADGLHMLGEGIMASNPYTATAYFGGKALDDIYHGSANAETAVNAGFAALPWLKPLSAFAGKGLQYAGDVGSRLAKFSVSNHTGNWTQFGNNMYRLKPGYLGINSSSPIETRRMVSLNRVQLELIPRLHREATREEIEQFLSNNPNLFVGMHQFPGGRAPVVAGDTESFNRALNNLNTTLQGKYFPETPITLRGPYDEHQSYTPILQPSLSQLHRAAQTTSAAPIRTRSPQEVLKYGRYTKEDLFTPNGRPRPNLQLQSVNTGAHGSFIDENSSSDLVFNKLAYLHYNPEIGRRELSSIMMDNPKGRSGVIFHTHTGDLSVDSHPLAQAIARTQGESLVPITDFNGRVTANNFGYKNLFVDKSQWELEPELRDYLENVVAGNDRSVMYSSPFKVSREPNGTLLVRNNNNRYVGRIAALPEEEVLENAFNAPIMKTNKHFGIQLPKAILSTNNMYPQWTFRKSIDYPSFGVGAIGMKKGGKVKQI